MIKAVEKDSDGKGRKERPAHKNPPEIKVLTSLGAKVLSLSSVHTADSFLGTPASAASTSCLRALLVASIFLAI